MLREPLETGQIRISRAARQTVFPARFQLVAAMNPCPCGYAGDPDGRCRCTADQVQRYRQRISGPLLDRIDLQLNMPRIPWQQLHARPGEDSRSVRQRVEQARSLQTDRGTLNARLSLDQIQTYCRLDINQQKLMDKAVTRFHLSPRGIHRILKVARSIADLADSEHLLDRHLQEAIGYRCLAATTA